MEAGQLVIEPVLDAASMSEDQILQLTQKARVGFVRGIMETAKTASGLPDCTEQRDALFKNLDALEKVALTKKKITADKEGATGVSNAVHVISQLLRQSTNHYGSLPAHADREPPKLGSHIPEPVLVEGETEIEAAQMDYDSFVTKAQQAKQA